MAKFLVALILALLALFTQTKTALAALYINEFVSDTAGTVADPDWVEIYNSDSSSVDLSDYRLEDLNATNTKNLSGTINANGFATVDWSNKLNKTGDVITLKKISNSSQVDRVAYGDQGSDITTPSPGQSAGRQTDGIGSWSIFSSPTKGSTNNTSSPTPSPSPSPNPSPTPTPSPSPSPAAKSPSPTPKTSPSPSPNASPETQVLGEGATAEAKASPSPATAAAASKGPLKVAGILTGSGLILIGLSVGFYLWYKRTLEGEKTKERQDQEQS